MLTIENNMTNTDQRAQKSIDSASSLAKVSEDLNQLSDHLTAALNTGEV